MLVCEWDVGGLKALTTPTISGPRFFGVSRSVGDSLPLSVVFQTIQDVESRMSKTTL